MSGDNSHNESDQGGDGDHLSLSKHHTHGVARLELVPSERSLARLVLARQTSVNAGQPEGGSPL
jgi:hypothetical protein